ncbi:MAG TPA: hypothetical protein VJV05_16470 [Pyrinomonadaceae bacterium]|nr:hypothetical protein [Pyrinomonadaceae bacterium]
MKKSRASSIALLGIVACCVASGCGPNERIMNSAAENRAEPETRPYNSTNTVPTVTGFKQDLEAMRTADFKFIVVFRRKDGAKLGQEDKETIGRITGQQVNRRKISDEGKAVIIGSNFPFLPGMLEELTEKFKMEDYSKPDSGPLVANTSQQNSNQKNTNQQP